MTPPVLLAGLLLVAGSPSWGDLDRLPRAERSRVERGEIVVETIPTGDPMGGGVRAVLRLDSPVERVYDVLAAVERYPAWMPKVLGVEAAPIDTAGVRLVGFRVDGPFGEVSYVVERHHARPGGGRPGRIWWRLASGGAGPSGGFREMTGAWELVPNGRSTVAVYRALVRPARWVPQSLVRSFARGEVREMLEAVRRRIASDGV